MKTVTILPLIFLSSWAAAQTQISGKVTDAKGEALLGANIYLENTYDGASSELDGTYQFKTDETGVKVLRVEYLGYKAQQQEIELNGEPVRNQFVLEEEFNELNAVVITAGSFEAGDKKRSIVLSPLDVATTSGAMGDIVGAINTLPGTTPVGESGRLYVRGGSDNETKTFVDGLLVSQPYHASGPNLATRGRFNPFLFNGVVFNTGGYSAEYGQALSSVLLLNTIDEKQKDELNLSFLIGLGADFAGTKSWEGGSVTASGNYFNIKPYEFFASPNQEWEKPAEIFSQETSFKQRTGKGGMFKSYSNINRSNFSLRQNDLDQPGEKIQYEQTNTNYFLNTSWTNTFSEKWLFYSGFSATINNDEMDINETPMSEKLHSAHVKVGWDYQPTEKINIRFGPEYFFNDYSFTNGPALHSFKSNFRSDLAAGYLEANIYTSNRLVFRVGGRAEYSPLLQRTNIAPRFSSAYKIDDNSQLSFAYGQFYQVPAYEDLMWDQDLGYERADHYVLNYQKNVEQRVFRAEVYYKNYLNLVRYTENTPGEKLTFSNSGNGYAYGLDVFVKDAQSIHNGQFWVSYSYLETERMYLSYPKRTTPGFASKHNASIVYKHFVSGWRSMVSTDFSFSSPRLYTDPNREGFNNTKMKSYHSLNASWAYLYRNHIIVYGAVSNILGRDQEFGYRFSTVRNSEGRYESEPITPFSDRFYVLGLFFTFSKDKTKNQLNKLN